MNWRTCLIVAVALLALGAMPASAQNASAVASEHTTFGSGSAGEPSPTQLTNMTVENAGEEATVTAGTDVSYNPVFAEGDGSVDFGTSWIGGDNDGNPESAEIRIAPSVSGEITTIAPNISGSQGSDYGFTVDIYIVEETPDSDFGEGTLVKSGWDPDYTTGYQSIPLDTSYQVDADTDYTIEFVPSGGGDNEFQLLNLNVDSSANSDWYTSLGSPSSDYADMNVEIAREPQTARFVGSAHNAEDVSAGWANLTLSNASADIVWQEDADNDGSWKNVTTTTVSSTSNVTQDLSNTQSDRWRVRVDISKTGSGPVAKIHDEGLLFDSSSPTLSDPQPPDDVKIANAAGNVSINVSDADFPLAQVDSVSVSATDGDGTSLGSTTLTNNGTASFSYSSEAGTNTIEWTASDDYGNTETFTQTFTTPENLYIRNESAPSKLVNTPANITATFYGDGGQTVVERSSSDGTFNLAGLPTDTEYVVQVNADGFRSRQVVITSLFDQQNVYLLPKSAPGANVQFELNDQTSRFPAEDTTLFIEMPITVNGSTDYRTVFADQFGATSALRVSLRDNQRYRLKVRNAQGEVRALSTYTTSGAATEILTIGQVAVSGTVSDVGVAFDSQIIETEQGDAIKIVYRDPEQRTSDIEVAVEQNGSKVVPNLSGDASDGRFIATVPIQNDTAENATFDVSYQALRGGETIGGSQQVGDVGSIDVPVPKLPRTLMAWTLTLALMSMVVIRTPRLAPATGTATASAMTVVGWLAIPAPALGIAGAISVLAVMGRGAGQ